MVSTITVVACTPFFQYQTLEGNFELTQHPSRYVACGTTEVQGHHQICPAETKEATSANLNCVLVKSLHFIHDHKKAKSRNKLVLVTRPDDVSRGLLLPEVFSFLMRFSLELLRPDTALPSLDEETTDSLDSSPESVYTFPPPLSPADLLLT